MVMDSSAAGSTEDSPASTAPSSTASEVEGGAGAAGAAHTPEKPPDDTSKLRMFLGILRK